MEEIEKLVCAKVKTSTIALRVEKQWTMELRNGVIHEGQPVTEKLSQRILDVTNDLLDELPTIVF
jgi:hypothetical protein